MSNLEDVSAILKPLKIEKQEISDIKRPVYIVNLKWLTDSNKHVRLCDQWDKSYFKAKLINGKLFESDDDSPSASGISANAHVKLEDFEVPDYECQRATPLHHFNEELTVSFILANITTLDMPF